MNNILDAKAGTITVLESPTLSGKTRQMLHILEEAIQHQVPTLFVSLELTKEQIGNQVSLKDYIYIAHNAYIEKICDMARRLKANANIKLILVDSIIELNTRQKLCLGMSDIRFHILKQLKQLADELDVAVIITGPANIETEIKNIHVLDIKNVNLNSV